MEKNFRYKTSSSILAINLSRDIVAFFGTPTTRGRKTCKLAFPSSIGIVVRNIRIGHCDH